MLQPQQAPLAIQTTGNGVNTLVSQQERDRYSRLFTGSGPANGLLDGASPPRRIPLRVADPACWTVLAGDKARDIFIKSKLPFETLGQIWNLADTRQRGALDVADFTLGMHLIQATMSGHLPSLPQTLPPALYASAAGVPAPGSPSAGSNFAPRGVPGSPLRQGSVPIVAARAISPPPPMPASYAPSSPLRQPVPASPAPAAAGGPWSIDSREKAESDGYFATLDPQGSGIIEGEAAAGFFAQSGLGMEILAKVWDLADIRGEGQLNKEEFAVALRLIRDQVQGKPVPDQLEPSMVPPSLRAPVPALPQRDLLNWDDDDAAPSVPVPTLQPQATGASANTITSPQMSLSPQPTGIVSLQGSIFPQNSGQAALSPQSTGFKSSTSRGLSPAPPVPAANPNFFDQNDDNDTKSELSAATAALSKEHAQHTATLSGLREEHQSSSSSIAELTAQREALATKVAAANGEIDALHTKLATTRASHESERTMFEQLKGKHADQSALLSRAKHELISAESDLSALRVERTEVEGEFLRDKEDVRELKRKMAEVAVETQKAREVLEKVRKEARQQKGLLAISKKQLASAEADHAAVKGEIAQAEAEHASPPVAAVAAAAAAAAATARPAAREVVEDESPFDHTPVVPAPVAAAYALPASPPVFSPTASQQSLNPFARMGGFTPTISPQVTGAAQDPTHAPAPAAEESHSLGLPVAAVAAVGAGAVAAVTAVGATVAHAIGIDESQHKEETPAATVEEVDPFGVPVSQAKEIETDPFGVPDAGATGGSSAFDSDFSAGFGGDDFGSTPTVTAPAADFDAAFADLDEPLASAPALHAAAEASEQQPVPIEAEQVVATSAIAPAEPEAGAGPLQESPIEGAAFGANAEPVALSEAEQAEEADSSDDEDEGPEDAAATHQPKSLAASQSDSGESFVHVPSAPETATEADKFPALDAIVEPAALVEPEFASAPQVVVDPAAQAEVKEAAEKTPDSPSSELDSFEDAENGQDVSGPTAGVTEAAATAAGAGSTRRAAPPPPTRSERSSVSAASPVSPGLDDAADRTVPAPTEVAMPAKEDWDAGFSDLAPPTPVPATEAREASLPAADDFESAFSDLAPGQTLAASTSANQSLADQFDDFGADNDDSFSFQPTFDNDLGSGAAHSAQGLDESSFADFDSAFAPAVSASAAAAPAGFGRFDDSFGSPAVGQVPFTAEPDAFSALNSRAVPGSGGGLEVPAASAAAAPTPALDNDSDAVKQITLMGFSRTQAVDALDKYDGNVERALNLLVG